jgi:argininosuccinate lyase
MALYYLLYVGVARNDFSYGDLEGLLQQARSRNEHLGITGKLLHCEGTFIQLLEGSESAVEEVFSAIEKDQRLVALKTITIGTAQERHYEHWSMAYSDISIEEINQFENCRHPDVAAYIKNSSAIKLLKLLART